MAAGHVVGRGTVSYPLWKSNDFRRPLSERTYQLLSPRAGLLGPFPFRFHRNSSAQSVCSSPPWDFVSPPELAKSFRIGPMLSNLNEQKTFYVPEFDLVGLIVDPVLNSGWGTLYDKSKFPGFPQKRDINCTGHVTCASSTAVAWRTLPFPCNYPSSMTHFLAAIPMMQ